NDKQYVLDSDGNILFTCLKDYIIKEKKQILYENKYNMIVFGVREKSQYTENSFYGEDINSEIFANLEEFDNAIKSKIYNYGVVINALYPYFIYTEGKDVETYKFFKTEDEAKKYAIENNLTYKNVQRPIYYGIMDKSGKIVLEPDYVNISEFNEEYVSVLNKDSKHGVVDIKGNVVVDFKYPSQIHYLGNGMFSYGIQNRYEEKINDEYIDVKFEDKAFVIDKTGKVLVECESTYGLFDNGPIVIKKDSKYQLYDLNLNPISKEYDFLDHNAYYDFPFNFIYLYGKEFKKTKYVVVYNKL
ncbi:MAG: WG repeat-containing protein, partial [Abditibacteriota bacterium]|nr:WG repeat-containing protein [Abditibacteriota bacterium]